MKIKNRKVKKSIDTLSIRKQQEKKILRKIFTYLLIRLGKVENTKNQAFKMRRNAKLR
jgi:hypothetical protein